MKLYTISYNSYGSLTIGSSDFVMELILDDNKCLIVAIYKSKWSVTSMLSPLGFNREFKAPIPAPHDDEHLSYPLLRI